MEDLVPFLRLQSFGPGLDIPVSRERDLAKLRAVLGGIYSQVTVSTFLTPDRRKGLEERRNKAGGSGQSRQLLKSMGDM
jgi:hypothetical protein